MTSDVERIKEAVDIVALIGEKIKLTKAGKNYKGLCPFHNEKSPSFFVSTELGRYKCFGCQESGDVFTFLQKYEGLSFAQAVEVLAKRAGIELANIPYTKEDTKQKKLLEILSLAKEYYHFLLTKHRIGESARAYLKQRGIHSSTVELFGIGYAPAAWDGLLRYLTQKKHYDAALIEETGLIIRSQKNRYYDRFRDRIMFPLTNKRGEVVGFSGRLLEKHAKEAKYINTPETTLYHKSELLFGYSQLQRFIRDKAEVLICEGEFDVLSSYQAHISHVVAIKGSALTTKHIQFLSHSVQRIILALDADSAGIEATKRCIDRIRDAHIDVVLRVLPLSGGKDPDEIASENPALWRAMVGRSVSAYEYLIDVAFQHSDGTTGEGKREITKKLAPLLSGISNAVEQAHYIGMVAKRLGVKEDVLAIEVSKVGRFGAGTAIATPTTVVASKLSRRETLVRFLIGVALTSAGEVRTVRFKQLRAAVGDAGVYTKLLEEIAAIGSVYDIQEIQRSLPKELTELFATVYMESVERDVDTSDDSFEKSLSELIKLEKQHERVKLATQISKFELKDTLSQEEERELKTLRAQMLKLT